MNNRTQDNFCNLNEATQGRNRTMNNDDMNYRVVFNGEGRFSIWPEYKEIPLGWTAEGTIDKKQACLDHISDIWTDMRPNSLREALDS